MTLQPGQQLGPYEILGPGPAGQSYRATDSRLGRIVAIELLPPTADDRTLRQLRHDVEAASRLRHPNICSVYGLDEAAGHTFIVSEFCDGETLRDGCRSGMPFAQVLSYGREIAHAIGHAHRQGVVHRHLNGSRVLVTADGHVKVCGFGLGSWRQRDESTESVAYVAPERLRGDVGGPPADVWALGVMFWEMTTGESPFGGNSPSEVRSKVLYSPLMSPPLAWTESFRAVAFQCLSKSPDGRYRDAADLAAALKAIRLTGREYRWWSQWRPLALGAGALVAALTIAVPTYRLVAGKWDDEPRAVPAFLPSRNAAAIQQRTLAVLPFTPLDPSAHDAPLELGLADTLIASIGTLPGVSVQPVSAVLRYAEHPTDAMAAGRELHAEAVIEGTIEKVEDRLRVAVRLLNVADGRSLWNETFAADSTGALGVQDAIARRVSQALVPELDERIEDTRHGTLSVDAYRAYLEGRYYWHQSTEAGLRSAIPKFERAVALDPAYALAYAALADCQTLLGVRGLASIKDSIEHARVAALQATLADESLPEGHGSLAVVRWLYDWNWELAEREFTRALQLNPSYAASHRWYAYFLAARSRFPEALAEIQRARGLDPLSLSIRTDVGELSAWARRPDEAVAELRAVVDADANLPIPHVMLGLSYLSQRRTADALEALERARQIDNDPRTMSTLAYAYGIAGNRVRAQALLAELTALSKRRHISPFAFSLIYVGLGDRDRAFASLERALLERSNAMAIIDAYPWLDPLRADPRFEALRKGIEANRYH